MPESLIPHRLRSQDMIPFEEYHVTINVYKLWSYSRVIQCLVRLIHRQLVSMNQVAEIYTLYLDTVLKRC